MACTFIVWRCFLEKLPPRKALHCRCFLILWKKRKCQLCNLVLVTKNEMQMKNEAISFFNFFCFSLQLCLKRLHLTDLPTSILFKKIILIISVTIKRLPRTTFSDNNIIEKGPHQKWIYLENHTSHATLHTQRSHQRCFSGYTITIKGFQMS